MAKIIFNDGISVGDFLQPYVIAEVNSSHNGCVETAKKMIVAAKNAGCACVKFQSWSAESLYSKTYYDNNKIAERIVKKFSMSEAILKEMASYCAEVGISFASTPYAREEVDTLLECKVPFIKVASMEINNFSYLKYIAQTGSAIILSTGMAEFDEIKKAIDVIKNNGNTNLAILHCVSIYPAAPSTIHLNNINMLRKEFPDCVIGFSDHTLGTEIPTAATALGSGVIEKHLTLDKSKMGMDNNMAIEPEEMKQLVNSCHNVYEAMGSYERVVSDEEYKQRTNMRRSVIARRSLQADTILLLEDLGAKRPGDGISVDKIEGLVGKKLKNNVEADCLIRPEDIV